MAAVKRKIFTRDDRFEFPLYRFTKRRYLDRFFESGELRLGTLFDYAATESYSAAVHDKREGYCAFNRGLRNPEVGEVHIVVARNNYALCLSEVYNESMYAHFDADVCLVIDSLDFFECIDAVMESDCTELLLRRVVYLDKLSWSAMPRIKDFAGVYKDSQYSYQQEVRALWEPKAPPPELAAQPPLRLMGALDEHIEKHCESELSKEYVRSQCDWIQPRTIFVPDARRFCSLREK